MLHKARDIGTARDWDPAIAIPTLVGSLLSLVASTTVILCWSFFGDNRRSFRYALILNLTVAELINSLNNSVSGLYVVIENGKLQDGPVCDLNGWIGQFSVQAIDFSILAISVVTLLTIQLKSYIIYASTPKKITICVSVWIIPLITSSIALAFGLYEPVSGNWCWIAKDHNAMRYALGHGWRLAVIFLTFCIYVFVFLYMHKRLQGRRPSHRTYSFDYGTDPNGFEMNFRYANSGVLSGCSTPNRLSFNVEKEKDDFPSRPQQAFGGEKATDARGDLLVEEKNRLVPPPRIRIRHTTNVDKDVWRMVLLNMYPVTYLILWLPGLVNRLAEATGHYSRALRILQSLTQYVGLANACVYAFREHRGDIRSWWKKLRG